MNTKTEEITVLGLDEVCLVPNMVTLLGLDVHDTHVVDTVRTLLASVTLDLPTDSSSHSKKNDRSDRKAEGGKVNGKTTGVGNDTGLIVARHCLDPP